MAKTVTTSPTVNSGQGALPRTADRGGRLVPSEGPHTYTQTTPRDTHRIAPGGAVPR